MCMCVYSLGQVYCLYFAKCTVMLRHTFDKDLILIHTCLSEFSRPSFEAASSKLRVSAAVKFHLLLHVLGHVILGVPRVTKPRICR